MLVLHLGYSHDIKMAIFEISENESGLIISASLDKEDFLKTLAATFPAEFPKGDIMGLAFEYLNDKLAININGACTSLVINEIEFGRLNIHLKGSLKVGATKIREVEVRNTCMIDLFEGHDNIIKLKLNNRSRSFRLNKNRTSTTAFYE
ncbi:MAG: DUF6702 family protein [Ekhidna sp.]